MTKQRRHEIACLWLLRRIGHPDESPSDRTVGTIAKRLGVPKTEVDDLIAFAFTHPGSRTTIPSGCRPTAAEVEIHGPLALRYIKQRISEGAQLNNNGRRTIGTAAQMTGVPLTEAVEFYREIVLELVDENLK